MKLYTCAPRAFVANAQFFSRDSGLLCRALQEIGIESKVILPSMPGREIEDTDEIVRVSEGDFRNPEWWRSLGIDGVVFFVWGYRKDTPPIRAATESGVVTCAVFDHTGNNFPIHDFLLTLKIFWTKGNYAESFPRKLFGTIARGAYFGIQGLFATYYRSEQFSTPHIAAFNSPTGLSRNQKLVQQLHPGHRSEMVLAGWPVPDHFSPLPREQRKHKIISIGRWDAIRHKRPFVLMRVAEGILRVQPDLVFEIFGFVPPLMTEWHRNLPEKIRPRVLLRGLRPNEEITAAIGESKILYCPSASDGIPLVAIEGLGGGCSIVGLRSIDVAGMYWAISEGDGTFAENDDIDSHVGALSNELRAWDSGLRDPMQISTRWRKWFAAKSCARKFVELVTHHLESHPQ